MKSVTAEEVRKLPEGTRVCYKSRDPHGWSATLWCEVVRTRAGRGVELRYSTRDGFERMPIRAGKKYAVEE